MVVEFRDHWTVVKNSYKVLFHKRNCCKKKKGYRRASKRKINAGHQRLDTCDQLKRFG